MELAYALAVVLSLPSTVALHVRNSSVRGYSKNTKNVAFELVRVDVVEEYDTEFTLYRHVKTGAEVLSATNEDENKVFGIAFRTPPSDSTGVPHIMEHSVLCGSDKYPVKEPFVHLLRSSMQTYLNAYTYPDRTVYPVASQNLKDFHNLVNIYLDGVFHPRAIKDPQVLQQEGWHYEIKSPTDQLSFKGIVFNEMKGVYGSPDARLQTVSQEHLFPNNTYRYNSGGDPQEIPKLTFDSFKAFYAKHYHPSNARVFFYGNDPVDSRLAVLDSYLSQFGPPSSPPESTRVDTQPKWSAPRRVIKSFPVAPGQPTSHSDPQHAVLVSWLLNEEHLTSSEKMSLVMLNHLLIGSANAPLHKALMQSALGESVIGGGLSDSLKQVTFAIGLKGVAASNVSAVEALIEETLHRVVSDGFPKEAVEASLNMFEFSMREFSSSSSGKGIAFLDAIMQQWVYERDPLQQLRFRDSIAELRTRLSQPDQRDMENLVQIYLLDNAHRLTVEAVPDPSLSAQEELSEQDELQKRKKMMNTTALNELVKAAARLKEAQQAPDSPEALKTLPTLALSDLDRRAKDIDIHERQLAGATLLTHKVASNGVAYVDVALDASALLLEDVPLLPLFTALMFDVGTSSLNRTAFEYHVGANTGGLSASFINTLKYKPDGKVGDLDDVVLKLLVHGKALANRTNEMLTLMLDGLTDANLDNRDRVLEILKTSKASMEDRLRSSGNSLAMTRIAARRSLAGYIDEVTHGLTYYHTILDLVTKAEKDWSCLLARLHRVRASLLDRHSAIVNLAADEATLEAVASALNTFVQSLPVRHSSTQLAGQGRTVESAKSSKDSKDAPLRLPPTEEGFVVPTQVNFVVKGGELFRPGQKILGSSQVITRFLSNGYMWDTVRVMGGAYGGGCSVSPVSGTFMCYSYRDPNLAETLSAYDGVASYLEELQLDDKAVEQLIIGAVADLDQPISPAQQGYTSMVRFLTGQSLAMRQRWRDEIFATSPADFKDFAKQLRNASQAFHACAFGSQDAFSNANAKLSSKRQLHLSVLS